MVFGLLSLLMYLKGIVRVHPQQMYLSVVPALLLLAVLFEYRRSFSRIVRVATTSIVALTILAAGASAARVVKALLLQHLSVPQSVLASIRHRSRDTWTDWCARDNALTRGMCFLPEADRITAIEFIEDHTVPGQRLYVGLRRHDRIYINDNLIYFATQRLPATRWSHFDPGLQDSYPIQEEMIRELDRAAPPYIVEDAEFESVVEPNGSVKSSGVTVLDDYIHEHYRWIEAYGAFSIWQRK